ncbi:hypothetical protein BDW75DRAFT_131676 [Aspergillus navahoensis]
MKPNPDKRSTRIESDGVLVSNRPIHESLPPVSSALRSDGKGKEAAQSSGRLAKEAHLHPSQDPVVRSSVAHRELYVSKVDEVGEAARSYLVVRNKAPWDTFKKFYDCDPAGSVTVCTRQPGCRGACAIRQYPEKMQADRTLRILRSIRHAKVTSVLECSRTLYDRQLAAIMSQAESSSIPMAYWS